MYLKQILKYAALLSLILFQSCKDSAVEPDIPVVKEPSIVFFDNAFGGVRFSGSEFEDYICEEPYVIKPDCFEIINGKWYAFEYNRYFAGGSDVNLVVNGEKKATIVSNCSNVQNVVAYQQDGRLKAYIFYFDSDDNYHGIHYDNGRIENIDGLTDFERILFIKVINDDVYAVWNFDVSNFFEVRNIVITKNGTPIPQSIELPEDFYIETFSDLCVDNSSIYTFFTIRNDKHFARRAYYAKDNNLVQMTGLQHVSYGQVVDGKVYAIGWNYEEGRRCCYWENGEITKPNHDTSSEPSGLVIENGIVYYLVLIPEFSILYKDGVEYIRHEACYSGFKFIDF